MIRWATFLLLGLTAPAQDAAPAAPAGTWYIEGGNAARTRTSQTRTILPPYRERWSRVLDGKITAEPLVWGRTVALEYQTSDQRYRLALAKLHDGRPLIGVEDVASSAPLHAGLWNRALALRDTPNSIRVHSIVADRVERLGHYRSEQSLSGPLMFGLELYVRDGGDIVRLALDGRTIWRTRGNFLGELSLRHGAVLALERTRRGATQLIALNRADGRRKLGPPLLSLDASQIVPDAGRVVAGDRFWFVRHPHPFSVTDEFGKRSNASWIAIPTAPGRTPDPADRAGASPLAIRHDPTTWDDHALLLVDDPQQSELIETTLPAGSSRWTFVALADQQRHPVILSNSQPIAVAGSVAASPAVLFDREDWTVRWRPSRPFSFAPIAARRALLVVRDQQLAVLESDRPATPPALFDTGPVTGRVILRDGRSLSGSTRISDQLFRVGQVSGTADAILWAERLNGSAWAIAQDADDEVIDALIADARRREWASAADRAVNQGDPSAEATLLAAAAAGVDRLMLDRLRRALPQGLQEPLSATRRTNIESAAGLRVHRAVDSVPAASPLRFRLLRSLRRHGGAAVAQIDDEVLRRMEAQLGRKPRMELAPQWLDFLIASSQIDLERVTPDAEGDREQRALARQAGDDRIGFRSHRIFVIGSASAPGALARCLSKGELVIDALDAMFDTARDVETKRLHVQVFSDREAYLRSSPQSGHALNWTAGHYSPVERLSRVVDSTGEQNLLTTLAHELTHQWIEERRPARGRARRRPDARGYWVVEGLATFVEEFEFDEIVRTWRASPGRSTSLDVVANLKPAQRLDWSDLLSTTQRSFQDISRDTRNVVPSRWMLGQSRVLSPTNAFYLQSAALCHWAWSQGPARRRQLLDFVLAYYGGRTRELDGVFGLSAPDLGARVEDFARRRIR